MVTIISLFTLISVITAISMTVHCFIKRSAATFLHPKRSFANSSPSDYGIETWESVSFKSADGLSLGAWFIPAKDPTKATIIFVHGIRGNRSSLMGQASKLIHAGFGGLLIELRNHGVSEGNLTTMSAQEVFDIEGAVKFLKTREDVNQNNLGIMGHSLGAATAIRAAVRQPELNFVIAQASFADLCDSMHQAARALAGLSVNNHLFKALLHPLTCLMIRYAQKQVGQNPKDISPKRDLQSLDIPCLFIHGLNDKTICPTNSQCLFEHAKNKKELLLIKNMGHSSTKHHLNDALMHSLVAFAEKHGHNSCDGGLSLTTSALSHSLALGVLEKQVSLVA